MKRNRPDKIVHINPDILLDDVARTGRPESHVAKEARVAGNYFSVLKHGQRTSRWSTLRRVAGALRQSPKRYLTNGDTPRKVTAVKPVPLFNKTAPSPGSFIANTPTPQNVIKGYLALGPDGREKVDAFLSSAKEIGL